MTGYFLPLQTDSNTFKFSTVDDSATLSVGGATAFDACAQQQAPITSTDFTIIGINTWGGSLPDNIEGSVYMYAGYYYPMKAVYSNAVSWAQFDCTVPDPSSYTVSTITEPWTGTFTSTSTEMTTVTGTNGLPTDETVIVIRTPSITGLTSISSSTSGHIISSVTSSIYAGIANGLLANNGLSVFIASLLLACINFFPISASQSACSYFFITVTSEASKQTSLATATSGIFSTVPKPAAPTSYTVASSITTGIVVQSKGIAAGLRTNALSTLAGIFILFFN
ncbi:hypothetical protein N7582_002882 [Saccharomyces uvarum]|nr:hypothetical protein N7582_002882 [Saccharomyces uvarum]